MSDTSLVFTLVARERVSEALGSVETRLKAFGSKITGAVAGVGVAAPYVAAAATAAGALAAGAVAAGAAVGAFKAAAAPQLEEVTNAWTLYDAAQKAAAQGGDKAAAAQKAYTQAMAQMPPATRATAQEFIGLKSDFGKWSDSLSGTTMPIFTRGIQGLRAALPALTPLVQAAAKAVGGFVDDIAAGAKSNGFKAWIKDFASAAAPALSNFLTVVKNLATGVGALLHAFLPMSAGMTGGLARMSQSFATWAKGLENSAGFARFLDLASSGKGALGNLATALGQLLVSLAPFMGATTIVAQGLADIIGAIPPGVITVLAQAFIAASVGMKAWAIATSIWSGVQRVATAVQWAMNSALLASPITWIIIGVVALVAAIVLIATKTTWFQDAWKAMSRAVSAAWDWVVSMVKQGWDLLVKLFMNFTLVGLIISHWNSIKSGTVAAWHAVVNFVKAIPGKLVSLFLNFTLVGLIIKHWHSIKDGTVRIATSMVNWLRGLPGRVIGAVASLGGRLYATGTSAFNRFRSAAVSRGTSAVSWVRGLPGRVLNALGSLGKYLYNSGRSLIQGFVNGIKSMASAPANAVKGVLSSARNLLPFSPAKEGPFSGSGWTLYSGRSIIRALAQGIRDQSGEARTAMNDAVTSTAVGGQQPIAASRPAQAAPITRAGAGRPEVRLIFDSHGEPFMDWLKERIRVEYGGDVTALNTGR